MNLETIELAQTELKNLAYKISDEELEKAGTATDCGRSFFAMDLLYPSWVYLCCRCLTNRHITLTAL